MTKNILYPIYLCRHASTLTKGTFILCLLTWTLSDFPVSAQDTLRRETLLEVEVSTQREPSTMRVAEPTQVVNAEKIAQTGATQLSDALKQLAGVTLKDYGGIGGMKTVSARGLGSQFSALTIDGVSVSDAQNGQIDMGRYFLGNSAYVSFANGQHDDMLQSARSYSSGNIINMETAVPHFGHDERTHLKLDLSNASFGSMSQSALWQQKLGNRLSLSLWGNHMRSDGDYPFTLYYTHNRSDSSSTERRQNTQMHMTAIDGNIFFLPAHGQQLHVKAHYLNGYHALPGPVILYNKTRASEHSEEQMFFLQARYQIKRERLQAQILGKFQLNDDLYEDTARVTRTHNEYHQKNYYLSSTLSYVLLPKLKASLAVDGSHDRIDNNLAFNDKVRRWSLLSTAALRYESRHLTANAHLLATMIHEDNSESTVSSSVLQVYNPADYRRLSPYVGLVVQPVVGLPLRIRYFFKETYRVPNFSELYFFTTPKHLDPECATQHNIGITYILGLPRVTVLTSVDGYRNRVHDKIIAMPRQNMFVWSMYNLGRVDIDGIDASLSIDLNLCRQESDTLWHLKLSANYSYQEALDHTDPSGTTPEGKSYGHQIPYTPRHSATGNIYLTMPWVNLGYTIAWMGERYSMAQNIPVNRMVPYCDQGISLDRSFNLRHSKLTVRAQLLNIFDVQYEIVRSYPMMGRNWRLNLIYGF